MRRTAVLAEPARVLPRREQDALSAALEGDLLRFSREREGRSVRIVTAVDGPAFAHAWLAAVETTARAAARGAPHAQRLGDRPPTGPDSAGRARVLTAEARR